MKKLVFLICLVNLLADSLVAQVIVPFVKRYEANQRGGLVFVSNTMLTCDGGASCTTGQNEVPPNGNFDDNDDNSMYIDIDGVPATWSSSSADMSIPACSKVTFAGLYWGAYISSGSPNYSNRNKIKIKQPGTSSYTNLTADTIHDLNTNYDYYICYKNITSIVSAAGNGTYTMADLVARTGGTNQWAGWSIVVVYANDALTDKNFTVFDGLASIDGSNSATVTVSGFYTPPSGAVNFEFGEIAYDGDRGNTGESLQYNGAGSFVTVSDALHASNNAFNSSICNNAVQVLTRNPAYKNTLGFDANIFKPNNATKNYLANGATSAQIRTTSTGDQIFLQVITSAIETYEPFMQTVKTVTDVNGGQPNPGDTLLYTIEVDNNGNDDASLLYVLDTVPFNSDYIPGSINITSGPNAGLKTDASGDDQGSYNVSGGFGILRVNLGIGANSSQGGTLAVNGPNSITTFTFKVRITDDCTKLLCNSTISNKGALSYKGVVSGISRSSYSNPSLLDPFGCPVKGYTTTDINVPVSCAIPPDTSIGGCLSLKFDSIPGIRPGYTYYNSSWVSVIRANTAGTYYGIRNLTGTNCKDTIVYTVYATTATISNAGPDQNLCNVTSTNLAGNTPTVGAGKWTLVSGPNTPTFTSNTSPTTSVTGMVTGTYQFRWTISLSCDSSSDIVSVTNYATTTISNAGPDQNLCNVTSTNFAGNTPSAGTGNWTRISGPNTPTITTPSSPTSSITGMINGTYVFRWTITNGACGSTTDDVKITISANPTVANAGPDQNLCDVSAITLAGNNPVTGTGNWTVVSGPNSPTITTPSSSSSTVTAIIPGVYTLRWTISNGACTPSTDDVQITIYALPTVANAGSDIQVCNASSILLSGNNPVTGTGAWTMISGPNTPTIVTPNSSNTNVNGIIPGVYVFRWTISNGVCTPSTDDIQVTNFATPTVSNAGPDQMICNTTSATLAGNNPVNGTGTWSVISGPNAPTITAPSNPASTVTGMIAGVYTFRWTISNGVCTPSTNDMQITISELLTVSNAGPDQNLCNVNNVTLAGNTAVYGTGAWTLVSGPNSPAITNVFDPVSTVTGMIPGVYTFRWMISNGICPASTDEVQITIYGLPTVSNAGADQNLCNVTSTILAGNSPGTGSGSWTLISGPNVPVITNPGTSNTTVTGMIAGAYTFRWTISNGVCPASTDDVVITIYSLPTTSLAGADQNLCNLNSTTFAANTPVTGAGNWSMISGPNTPTITTPSAPNSTATGLIAGVYIFRWTIINGACTPSTDDVHVSVFDLPTVSNAGPDQSLCNVNNVTLAGNNAVTGTGTWLMVSGPNSPTITTPTNPASTVTGMVPGVYTFSWRITNGSCAPSLDEVVITIYAPSTVSNAGSDQNLCNAASATLAGNNPVNGSGVWTFISGPNTPTITAPANPSSTVTGMIPGVYVFRWTITNGVCASSFDEIQITNYNLPTVSNAGSDQSLCNVNNTTLAGNVPVFGSGNWTLISGPNTPTITTPSNPSSTVTGMIPGVYVLRWTISNGVCATSSDDVQISIFALPTVSAAGPDQNLCNVNNTTLAGNNPATGTGSWSLVGGPNTPTITTPSSFNSSVTGMIAGVYVFRWTISNGSCAASTDDVQITIYDLPTVSNAGPDQNLCNVNNTALAGNIPVTGSGTWTLISGPNVPSITTPSDPASTVTGMVPGVYVFRWSISNGVCAVSNDNVQITIYDLPTVSIAGPNQDVCDVTTVTLAGNSPVVGSGTWTMTSGPNAPTITSPSNPSTTVTGMTTGVYIFEWTISNGVCAPSVDAVQIEIFNLPTTVDAGPDQDLCDIDSATMAGNIPGVGTGTWTLISGPNVPTIADVNDPSTVINGMVAGTYQFGWTISNGVCITQTDTMVVVIADLPSAANAGADQDMCSVTSVNLSANTPVTGTGVWSNISGPNTPTITTPSNPNTTVTGMIDGVYVFRWTITSGTCAPSTDDVQVEIFNTPVLVDAGPDQQLCDSTTATMAGNVPGVGTGTWTLINGPNVPVITDINDPSTTATGMIAGTYSFGWTITNGVCVTPTDTVVITIFDSPTISDAGIDQQLCDMDSVVMAANTAITGTGNWSLISGPNVPVFTDTQNESTSVTGMISGQYLFQWTISNGVCDPSVDTMVVDIYDLPSAANAGADQDLCVTDSVVLNGNIPGVGTGYWTLISGPNIPFITDSLDAGTSVTGLIQGTYLFAWNISSGNCTVESDTVQIRNFNSPTSANAGPDQNLCNTSVATFSGNLPVNGTGNWTLLSGPNVPIIAVPSNEATTVSGLIEGTYEFVWTISNGNCTNTKDTVLISVYDLPTVSYAGPDQYICNVTNIVLAANTPVSGIGAWTMTSGPNVPVITSPSDSNSTVTGMIPGTYIFNWTITNGACAVSVDSVEIEIYVFPPFVDAGPDQDLCNVSSITLLGNTPTNGDGTWVLISGPNAPTILSPSSPSTIVDGVVEGTYTFSWGIVNGTCSSYKDTMEVTISDLPSIADAGIDQFLCNAVSTTLLGVHPTSGDGLWTLISGPNVPVIVDSDSGITDVTGMIAGTYQFKWTVTNGICSTSDDTVEVTIYSIPLSADAGPDQHLCNTTSIVMAGNDPAAATGTWILISGPNTPVITLPNDSATTVTGMVQGTYTFGWTINNGICSTPMDEVTIIIDDLPTPAFAGADLNLCNDTTFILTGNLPANGSGTWSFVSGPNVPLINSPNNVSVYVENLVPGIYIFEWTVSNGICPSSSDTVQIGSYNLPDAADADAGIDQELCNADSVVLAGNLPMFGTGVWTLISGPNIPVITDTLYEATSVTGMTDGIYQFAWTIGNGICPPTIDTVEITIYALPTVSNAGADQILCNGGTAIMNANTPVDGTGTWSLMSGPVVPSVDYPNDPNSSVSGLVQGAYTFIWEISNGICLASGDTTMITMEELLAPADAGLDMIVCDFTQLNVDTILAGNAPPTGIGTWTLVSGPNVPTINSPNSATTNVNGLVDGNYIFRWTFSNSVCVTQSDDIEIAVHSLPVISDAGVDQNLCNTDSITMTAINGTSGTGTWTFISGPNMPTIISPADPVTTVTGLTTGIYLFGWTLSNDNCITQTDTVQITIEGLPTLPDAGADQELCNDSTTLLAGNTLAVGNGTWSMISGPSTVVFADSTDPATSVSGLVPGVYIFSWSASNATCGTVNDAMSVTVYELPAVPSAGLDETLCGDSVITLFGSTPSTGTGTWNVSSGPNIPAFACNTCANTQITGLTSGVYTFLWTVTNGTCPPVSDDVQITRYDDPGVANAGPDQTICSGDTLTLTANTPVYGTGVWSIILGPVGPSIINPNDPVTTVTGMTAGSYTFQWIINNGTCSSLPDLIDITIDNIPVQPFAGSDTIICGDTAILLSGSQPVVGAGTWAVTSGPNIPSITCPTCPNTQANGLVSGVYIFEWININGVCPSVSDDVQITRNDNPGTANAGTDRVICFGDSVTLTADAPSFGQGAWSVFNSLGSPVIAQPDSLSTLVTNLDEGVHMMQWTISNSICSATDIVEITVTPLPVITTNASVYTICTGEVAMLVAGGANTYSWTPSTYLSDDSIFNPIASPNTTTGYVVTGTDLNGCVSSAAVTVEVCDLIVIPNGFSPDGDGVNDMFVIEGIQNYPGCVLQVFNRWGNIIYSKKFYDNTFDGIPNVNGFKLGIGLVPAGTYFYVFETGTGEENRSGYIVIKY